MRLMRNIRESIKEGTFVEFVRNFMFQYYKGHSYPPWVIDSLAAVNITLKEMVSKQLAFDFFKTFSFNFHLKICFLWIPKSL